MKKKTVFTVLIIATAFISASAHDMWIAPEMYNLKKGESVKATFPSAHVFPADDNKYVEKQTMADTMIISPIGKKSKLNSWKEDILQSKTLNEEGTYLIISGNKGGFYTKTTDGKSEKKPKNEVSNAAKGTYSKKFTKSLITVGNAGGTSFSKVTGQDLEIIPLVNPALLKAGDQISVKVLLNGKPYETELNATYDTYSKEKNVFAQKVKTDSNGVGKIKLSNTGAWLVRAVNKVPYSDPKKADEQSYTATLTFSIK